MSSQPTLPGVEARQPRTFRLTRGEELHLRAELNKYRAQRELSDRLLELFKQLPFGFTVGMASAHNRLGKWGGQFTRAQVQAALRGLVDEQWLTRGPRNQGYRIKR